MPASSSSPLSSSLPRIVILSTGGTIAGAADARSKGGYNAAAVSAQSLIAAVPGAEEIARIDFEQVAAIGSQDITDAVWLTLARRITELAARDDVDALLVTHGTDTMEETALFLHLTLATDKPVVMVGAMRPSTALSGDGPANLRAALMVATHPESRGRGVMVVLNDTIHGARDVTKTSTTQVETFQSPNLGPLGYVTPNGAVFLRPGTPRITLPLPESAPLPRVSIVHAYAGMDDLLIKAAIDAGARGLVLAGVGDGNAARTVIAALAEAAKAGVVGVRASRCPLGPVLRNIEVSDDALGLVAAGLHNPAKARVLLQVLLANGVTTPTTVQSAFDRTD
ncbi:asparaginase [Aquabacter cavernae]|uniref:asparaginase n=1 Tax=Aquabacter cavernae TaxID=2496029 RepID=UPI000F8DC35C|nr:asparaginase [Aquabacter cavernae]